MVHGLEHGAQQNLPRVTCILDVRRASGEHPISSTTSHRTRNPATHHYPQQPTTPTSAMPDASAELAPEDPAPAQLVAFAAAANCIGRSDFDLRSARLPKRPRSHRLDAVLDSLASICIRKGKGEVYAVAMQSCENNDSSAGGKLTLTVAGNCGVP